MKMIAVRGMFGGAGATSITANLAAAMHRRGYAVVTIDLCSSNQLRLHYGMPVDDSRGIFAGGKLCENFRDVAFETDSGLIYLPFGESARETEIAAQLQAIVDAMLRVETEGELLVFLDLPTAKLELLQALLGYSQVEAVLHIVEPEPRAYSALRYFSHYLWPNIQRDGLSHYVLFNKCAPHLELNRDIFDLLRSELADEVQVPTFIQKDQHVPESLATQQTVFEFTVGAQANVDFTAIAKWLEQQLELVE